MSVYVRSHPQIEMSACDFKFDEYKLNYITSKQRLLHTTHSSTTKYNDLDKFWTYNRMTMATTVMNITQQYRESYIMYPESNRTF